MKSKDSSYLSENLARRRFSPSRRFILKAGAATALVSAACMGAAPRLVGSSAAQTPSVEEFTIANWGGITSNAMLSAWGTLFTDRTGIRVNAVIFDYGKFVAQIESKDVSWNWADVEGWFPIAHNDLLEDLPYERIGVTAEDMVDPSLYTSRAVGSYLNSYVIAYRTDRDGPHPTTWADFFDVKAIPGKRSLYNWPYGMIEIALLADGVAYEDLYPLDLERAFTKIESIRDDVVFWNTGAEAQQLLVSNAIDFIVPWSSRASYLALGGLPIGVEWNQNLRIADFHVIPRNNPAREASVEFIRAALDPQAQADFAVKSGGLSPTTKEGLNLVDEYLKPYLSTYPENWDKAIGGIDDGWWAENLGPTTTKWYEFIGG